MRPHIEPIHIDDLVWHEAELPSGRGVAVQQNLSYDEESGAASTRVRFDSDWHRPGGWHAADTEWYVLAGEVELGTQTLGANDYWRAPAGLRVPPMRVAEGTEVLVFREYGSELFTVSGSDREAFIPRGGGTTSKERGVLTVTLAADASWNLNNLFQGHEEQRKLELAVLYQDFGDDPDNPTTGWFTNLVRVPPHKVGTLIEHHQIAEEAYNLVGMMRYNYGDFPPGAYFHRPPYLRHAYLSDSGGIGYTFLMRITGHLKNWHSDDVWFETGGEALNYDPDDPALAPVTAGVPVRSASTGVWDGRGR
jgi:hypothetical protein